MTSEENAKDVIWVLFMFEDSGNIPIILGECTA